MKKKIFGLIGIALLCAGCGKIPKLKNGEEAVVTFDKGKAISADDLYNELKDNYALTALVSMIDKQVLETEFKDYMETAKEEAENYFEAIKKSYETEEELLTAIQNYTGYSNVEAYQDYLYLTYMQSHAAEEYAKMQVTEKQIKKYYDDEVVGDIEVSHILITPAVTDDMDEDAKTDAEKVAKKTAEEVISKLKETEKSKIKDTFAQLAKEYSKDDATKNDGGNLGKINKDSLSSSYTELVDAAYKLKDGEYSSSAIKTELGYHVILRTKSYEKDTLENKKDSIIEVLSKEIAASDQTIGITALQYYRKKLGVNIKDSTLQKQYSNYIQNTLNSIYTNSNN